MMVLEEDEEASDCGVEEWEDMVIKAKCEWRCDDPRRLLGSRRRK